MKQRVESREAGEVMGKKIKEKCQKSFLLLNEIGAEEGNENEKETWIFQLIQSFCTKYLYLSSLVEALCIILIQNNLSKLRKWKNVQQS